MHENLKQKEIISRESITPWIIFLNETVRWQEIF